MESIAGVTAKRHEENLAAAVTLLAERRKELVQAKAHKAEIEAEIAQTRLGKKLGKIKTDLTLAQSVMEATESRVRQLAVLQFERTANKKPHPAVSVVLYKVYTYDPAKAMLYARKHIPTAIKLDKRRFEKATAVLELDFVEIGKEPRARIARDLTPYQ